MNSSRLEDWGFSDIINCATMEGYLGGIKVGKKVPKKEEEI